MLECIQYSARVHSNFMQYCIIFIKMSTLIYHSTAAKYDDRTNVSRKQNIASDWKQNMRLFTAAPTNRMEQSQILRQFLNGHVLVSQVFGGDFCSTYFGHLCGHETTCNEHLSSCFTKSSCTKSSQYQNCIVDQDPQWITMSTRQGIC